VYVCDEIALALIIRNYLSRLAFNAHEYDSAGRAGHCQGGLYKGFDAAHTVNKGQDDCNVLGSLSLVYLISIQCTLPEERKHALGNKRCGLIDNY
jgi:hypothetical protein